jgi:competence CoiA-like predicted nuclease
LVTRQTADIHGEGMRIHWILGYSIFKQNLMLTVFFRIVAGWFKFPPAMLLTPLLCQNDREPYVTTPRRAID